MTVDSTNVWKWVSGLLSALIVSNFLTAMTFRTTEEDMERGLKRVFTDVSSERGMYALEGRPRIDTLEEAIKMLAESERVASTRLTRMEQQLADLNEAVGALAGRR